MKKNILFTIGFALIMALNLSGQNFPFPQHTEYHGHIKPNQYTQAELDSHVTTFYNAWKELYFKPGCEDNQYHVFFDSGNTVTVSEAMGYGMIIAPLMAGWDADAKIIFNGLYRYYKAHPSHIMPNLMAWKQITGCIDSDGPDSATDGDIDIAFGLLLAHAQWGSHGAINYFQEALLIINDIMGVNASEGDINQELNSIKLGDWVTSGSYMNGTRTSDFIMDHFRAFACAVDDSTWYDVVDECYDLIGDMQTNYSPNTGLLPDFIDDVNTTPRPANPDYLEGENDGNYYYNACRDPWRITSDYLISGDNRAKEAVIKINRWLLQSAEGNANNVYAGYKLDGTRLHGWTDLSFTAPFTVGAMADVENQEWLNALYSKILQSNIAYGGYYDNSLKLLSMITLSGNYWVPSCDILNDVDEAEVINNNFRVYPTSATNIINVQINNMLTNSAISIKIYNSIGQLVKQETISNNENNTIIIGELSKGMYLVNVCNLDGNFIGTQKIFKQ